MLAREGKGKDPKDRRDCKDKGTPPSLGSLSLQSLRSLVLGLFEIRRAKPLKLL
jgi:hypothetical protein